MGLSILINIVTVKVITKLLYLQTIQCKYLIKCFRVAENGLRNGSKKIVGVLSVLSVKGVPLPLQTTLKIRYRSPFFKA